MRFKLLVFALLLCALPVGAQSIIYMPNTNQVQAGAGTGTARLGGVMYATATAVASQTTNDQEVLATYSIPANTLDVTGRTLRITAWGYTAANANNKTVYINFGTDQLGQSAHSGWNNQGWRITAIVSKVSNNLQTSTTKIDMAAISGGAITDRYYFYSAAGGVLNQTDTSAIALTITCRTPDAVGDLTFQGMIIEVLN